MSFLFYSMNSRLVVRRLAWSCIPASSWRHFLPDSELIFSLLSVYCESITGFRRPKTPVTIDGASTYITMHGFLIRRSQVRVLPGVFGKLSVINELQLRVQKSQGARLFENDIRFSGKL